MFKNVTLLLLHLTSLTSNSALFSPSSFTQQSYYAIQKVYLSKHYSTFLDLSLNRASSLISNSKFSLFLDSVVRIHRVDLPIVEGISDQDDNPANPQTSFICNHTSFLRNKTPYNGAAIIVHSNMNSINAINAQIDFTTFTENSALIGGAIYFESYSINMTGTNFYRNSAQYGSHIFLSCPSTSNIKDCIFQEGTYSTNPTSSIELTSPETTGTFKFEHCQFFLNQGPLRTNGANAEIIGSCFMNYKAGDYNNYNYKTLWKNEYPSDSIRLTNVVANDGLFESATNPDPNNPQKTASDSQIASCRLIPYPTKTSHYKISDEPAIFALVAIIFFVLVSIVGIFIVTCKKKKDVPPDQEAVEQPLKAQS